MTQICVREGGSYRHFDVTTYGGGSSGGSSRGGGGNGAFRFFFVIFGVAVYLSALFGNKDEKVPTSQVSRVGEQSTVEPSVAEEEPCGELRYGNPVSIVYKIESGKTEGVWGVTLPKAGVEYGPFVVSGKVYFYISSVRGRMAASSSKWLPTSAFAGGSKKEILSSYDTTNFYLCPEEDNVSFKLTLQKIP